MAAVSTWKIKIKTLKSDTFDINGINADSSVDELKQEIQKIKQITPDLQRLIFRGRILKSNTKLKDYEISNGSTIHLVTRKPNETNNAQNTSTNSTNANINNNNNNPMPFNVNNINQQQAAHFNAIQQMFQNLNQQQAMQQTAAAAAGGGGGAVPRPMGPMGSMPQMVFRRMPINNISASNTVRNVNDNDNEEEDNKHIDIKQAVYDDNKNNNLLKWKIKRTRIVDWIQNGKKYQSYFGEEQQLNNGSIWRFFIYPNGINQNGYNEDCVLFIMLEELPFGVDAMDVEFALHFKTCNINFKFRKTFNWIVRSTGWPRNFLLCKKIVDLPTSRNYVKFSCDLIVHSLILENGKKRMSNLEFMNWRKNAEKNNIINMNSKPNGRLYRCKLDQKGFIDAQFKQYQQTKTWNINGFKFYIQLYSNGLTRPGFVQPYLHLIKMPQFVTKIDAHFSFYFPEINVGYSHVDMFNGKMGKGWPDMRLKRDDVKWSDLKSITMDCRVNILNVCVNAFGWFTDKNNEKNHAEICEEEEEEKKEEIESVKDGDRDRGLEKDKLEQEFRKWLSVQVGLEQYFDNFIENEIHCLDDVVEYIEERNNLSEIGIKPFAHKAKMWKHIVKLKELREITNDEDEASMF